MIKISTRVVSRHSQYKPFDYQTFVVQIFCYYYVTLALLCFVVLLPLALSVVRTWSSSHLTYGYPPCIQSKLRSNNDSRQASEWRRSRHRHRLILSFMTHPADVVRIRSPRAGIVHPFKFDGNGSFRKRENFACTRCVILCYILHEFPLLHMFAL